MKFHIVTFGCQMNANDSEWIARTLAAKGWEEADEASADVYIVNTCSVRDKPEQKVYSQLGRLRDCAERRPGAFAAVGGCVAQQIGRGFFGRFPFVRLVFGTDGIASVPQALDRLLAEPGLRLSLLDFSEEYPERPDLWAEGAGPRPVKAFVNIMQGCDNFCAYCVVPYVRGRQKSRSSAAVLDECRRLARLGAREITLLGQNVNSYGLDAGGDGTTFADLLFRVAEIPGIERIRFTTSHPKDIAPEVIRAFGSLPNLCPQLHLPMQSGSDSVLAAMGRKYTLADYLAKIEALRTARPDIWLSTDLIVGFPGETEADFEATLAAMRRIGFDGAFSFKYSDRPGVRAERMQPKVPEPVKVRRLEILQALQTGMSEASLERMVGRRVSVLIEGDSRRSPTGGWTVQGRDEAGRVVNFDIPESSDVSGATGGFGLTGKLVRVLITKAKKHSLWGEMTGETW